MNWLVTWVVMVTNMVSCGPHPYYDDYGRLHDPGYRYASICYKTTSENQQKYFKNYEDALEFVNNGKDQSDLKDFEIIKMSD